MKTATWPDASSIPIVSVNRRQMYRTPDGDFPRVTAILKVLGLGTEALMKWAAETERSAAIMAATDVYAEGTHGDGPAAFALAVEQRLGAARQHVKELNAAADIGTGTHERVRWGMARELGHDVGPEPVLVDRSLWAWMAFDDWWRESKLKSVRAEQPVWSKSLQAAGTIDVIAENEAGELGIVDLKTSKYIYDEHHLQVAAYLEMGRNFADLKWAKIIRVPKKIDDPAFEVKELGEMYDRHLSVESLLEIFRAAQTVHRLMVRK